MPSAFEELEVRRALNRSRVADPDVDACWAALSRQIDGTESGRQKSRAIVRRITTTIAGIAAAVAIVMLVLNGWDSRKPSGIEVIEAKETGSDIIVSTGGHETVARKGKTLAFNQPKTATDTLRLVEVTTPRGVSCQLTLPDGTQVWLNADSKLSFPETFGATSREIYASGEAFFDVVKDTQRPFIVRTDYFTTTVKGTAFNLRAHSQHDASVALLRGSVSVKSTKGDEATITPGQAAVLSEAGGMSVADTDTYPLTQWKDGYFYFNDNRLADIMMELGRWYNVNVVFEDEKELDRHLHFVAEHSENLTDIITRMNSIGTARLTFDGETVTVR